MQDQSKWCCTLDPIVINRAEVLAAESGITDPYELNAFILAKQSETSSDYDIAIDWATNHMSWSDFQRYFKLYVASPNWDYSTEWISNNKIIDTIGGY